MAIQEWGDKKWFPGWMRQHQMEFLAFMAQQLHLYKPVVPWLQKLLALQNHPGWTDTCSGEGGPVNYLSKALELPFAVVLTDAFLPSGNTNTARTVWHATPVVLPDDLPPGKGLISQFNAWHHFSPTQQSAILQQVAQSGRPLLIAEILRPHIFSWLSVTAAATLGQFLFAPFIKPFRWSRLFFTYLVPVHIITVLYDGWVSVIQSQSANTMQQICAACQTPDYQFSMHTLHSQFSQVNCIIGHSIFSIAENYRPQSL